jgi:hypothetical protein
VDSYAAEVGVADHLLQGFAGGAALDQGGHCFVIGGGFGQDGRFLLGEDAAGRSEAGDGSGSGSGHSESLAQMPWHVGLSTVSWLSTGPERSRWEIPTV